MRFVTGKQLQFLQPSLSNSSKIGFIANQRSKRRLVKPKPILKNSTNIKSIMPGQVNHIILAVDPGTNFAHDTITQFDIAHKLWGDVIIKIGPQLIIIYTNEGCWVAGVIIA